MKKQFVIAVATSLMLAGVVGARADSTVRSETTTEKTTTYKGTVSEFAPGSSTIVLKSDSGSPTSYQVSEKTTFVDMNGNVVSRETVRNQPVTVYTMPSDGGQTVVSKVVVDRSGPAAGTTTHKETTVEERTK
jgi:kynureninase